MAGVAWWGLLNDLHRYLTGAEGVLTGPMVGVTVLAGQPATMPAYPCVLLLRGKETDLVLYEGGASGGPKGEVLLYLECYVREDDPDPAVGYAALAAMEGAMLQGVIEWALVAEERTGYDVIVSIEDVVGDAEAFRPVCGSRTAFRIEWSKFGQ